MVINNESHCPKCGGELKYYDKVERVVRTKGRSTKWVTVRRLRCCRCGMLHRELPEYVYPYKQYEMEVITGVLDGIITSDTLGYEDYPCGMTMANWTSHKSQFLL